LLTSCENLGSVDNGQRHAGYSVQVIRPLRYHRRVFALLDQAPKVLLKIRVLPEQNPAFKNKPNQLGLGKGIISKKQHVQ
jgi:hypothetical protein